MHCTESHIVPVCWAIVPSSSGLAFGFMRTAFCSESLSPSTSALSFIFVCVFACAVVGWRDCAAQRLRGPAAQPDQLQRTPHR